MAQKYIDVTPNAPIASNREANRIVRDPSIDDAYYEKQKEILEAQRKSTQQMLDTTTGIVSEIAEQEEYLKVKDADQLRKNYEMEIQQIQSSEEFMRNALSPDGIIENKKIIQDKALGYKEQIANVGLSKTNQFKANSEFQSTYVKTNTEFDTKINEMKITHAVKGLEVDSERISERTTDPNLALNVQEAQKNIQEKVKMGMGTQGSLENRFAQDLEVRVNNFYDKQTAEIERKMKDNTVQEAEIDVLIENLERDMKNNEGYNTLADEKVFGEKAGVFKTQMDKTIDNKLSIYKDEMKQKKLSKFKTSEYIRNDVVAQMNNANSAYDNAVNIENANMGVDTVRAATGAKNSTSAQLIPYLSNFYSSNVNGNPVTSNEYVYFGSKAEAEKQISDFESQTGHLNTAQKLELLKNDKTGLLQLYVNKNNLGSINSPSQEEQRTLNLNLKQTYGFKNENMDNQVNVMYNNSEPGLGAGNIDITDPTNHKYIFSANGGTVKLNKNEASNLWKQWRMEIANTDPESVNGGTISGFTDWVSKRTDLKKPEVSSGLKFNENNKYIPAEPNRKISIEVNKNVAILNELMKNGKFKGFMQEQGYDTNNPVSIAIDPDTMQGLGELIESENSKYIFDDSSKVSWTHAKELFGKVKTSKMQEEKYVANQKKEHLSNVENFYGKDSFKKVLGGRNTKDLTTTETTQLENQLEVNKQKINITNSIKGTPQASQEEKGVVNKETKEINKITDFMFGTEDKEQMDILDPRSIKTLNNATDQTLNWITEQAYKKGKMIIGGATTLKVGAMVRTSLKAGAQELYRLGVRQSIASAPMLAKAAAKAGLVLTAKVAAAVAAYETIGFVNKHMIINNSVNSINTAIERRRQEYPNQGWDTERTTVLVYAIASYRSDKAKLNGGLETVMQDYDQWTQSKNYDMTNVLSKDGHDVKGQLFGTGKLISDTAILNRAENIGGDYPRNAKIETYNEWRERVQLEAKKQLVKELDESFVDEETFFRSATGYTGDGAHNDFIIHMKKAEEKYAEENQ